MKFVSELSQRIDFEALPEEEIVRLYMAKGHALQSGIAVMIERDPHYSPETPARTTKHLRVGIDGARSDAGGLARLLIDKGLITKREYLLAILDGMCHEVETYERRLREEFGVAVTLG